MKYLRNFESEASFDVAVMKLDKAWVTLTNDDSKAHFMELKSSAAWVGGGEADCVLGGNEEYVSESPVELYETKKLTAIKFPAEATELQFLDSTDIETIDVSECDFGNPIIEQVKEVVNPNIKIITPSLYEVEIYADKECTIRPNGTYNLKTDYNTKPLYIKLNIPYENAAYYCTLNNYANKFISSTNPNIYFKIGLYSVGWEGPSLTFCTNDTNLSKVSEGLYKLNGTYGSNVTITFSQEGDYLLGRDITDPNYILPEIKY